MNGLNGTPSSSPAFGTPVRPIRPLPSADEAPTKRTILPIQLPAATLRPLAFRTFTKKHNLTLSSSALNALAVFIGKHCGSAWREEGLAEKILEEVAKTWKKNGGALIVDGDSKDLKDILKSLEPCIVGGKLISLSRGLLSRQSSLVSHESGGNRPGLISREDSQNSIGFSKLEVEDDDQGEDPRKWLRVISAYEQPRLAYNPNKKHFEKITTPPSLLPNPSHKTNLFRQRYNLIHQRLLRNESFQAPTILQPRTHSLQRSASTLTPQQAYKITPIANLLGRSGSNHVLLGMLTVSPTGTLAISDLTGSIALDLSHAQSVPENGAWFNPGMIVIVDGIYEEEGPTAGSSLGGGGGVGGTIGGRFVGLSVGGPPCERREVTLGLSGPNSSGDMSSGGGFGWVDFLGTGSEKACGSRMRGLEKRLLRRNASESGRGKMVVIGEVNLDNPKTLQALSKVLGLYATETNSDMPMAFVLVGNFVGHAAMAGGESGDSIEYKEHFDSMASVLSEYPTVLQAATFIFVPGDNDPWASAFSGGAATVLPRKGVPELFISRVKRVITAANAEVAKSAESDVGGEAIWTSNPSRVSLFGPAQEVVLFRDDISGRLRRNTILFKPSEVTTTEADEPAIVESPAGEGDTQVNDGMEIDEAVLAAESQVPAVTSNSNSNEADGDLMAARKLVKTILDQGYLSPFPLTNRPVLWDFAGALQLYPLPTAMVLVDAEAAPFTVTYEGCHVMNPGRFLAEGRGGIARWVEYDAGTRRGKVRENKF